MRQCDPVVLCHILAARLLPVKVGMIRAAVPADRFYRATECNTQFHLYSSLFHFDALFARRNRPTINSNMESPTACPYTPGAQAYPAHNNDTPTEAREKRKRQPRNSACQACASLKMKCVPAPTADKCERYVRAVVVEHLRKPDV